MKEDEDQVHSAKLALALRDGKPNLLAKNWIVVVVVHSLVCLRFTVSHFRITWAQRENLYQKEKEKLTLRYHEVFWFCGPFPRSRHFTGVPSSISACMRTSIFLAERLPSCMNSPSMSVMKRSLRPQPGSVASLKRFFGVTDIRSPLFVCNSSCNIFTPGVVSI